MKFFSAIQAAAFVLFCIGCTTSKVSSTSADKTERGVANESTCEVSNSLLGVQKQTMFMNYHKSSIFEISAGKNATAQVSTNVEDVAQDLNGANTLYVRDAFYPSHRLSYANDAVVATTKFLAPNVNESVGYKSLKSTFNRTCEFFQERETKKVHAFGTLASGRMIIYPKLKKLGAKDKVVGEAENPFTGLLGPQGNEEGVPLMMRLSIANPVAHTIEVGGKSLALEFIPGLGLKFLVDGQRSIDLVAMESLAGQGPDHNFFKYEFSPDFSAHAPSGFSTATGQEKKEMATRYGKNVVNHQVMNLVGKRFFQVIPEVTGIPEEKLEAHSNAGPHPFVISIQSLAQMDSKGRSIDPQSQKRPWRLVFKPALDNVENNRRAMAMSSAPYVPGKVETDFRYKLSSLKTNDRMYYVIAETEAKKRYVIGEIVLTSTLSPSPLADKLYFVQHQLDMRKTTFAPSIVNPAE
ncbi:hypothetical protein [Bdellovibrio sp. HCB337]|uniref:hypothetical protein n=1 Tax=Bdellovibrio sp. HCB337 TaxID=3394358 RepID=UPI0039A679D7